MLGLVLDQVVQHPLRRHLVRRQAARPPELRERHLLESRQQLRPHQPQPSQVVRERLAAHGAQVALLVASPPSAKQLPAAAPYNLLGNSVTASADNRMRQVFYATINLRDAVN